MATATFSGTYTANNGETYAAGTVAITPFGGSTTTATLDASGHYSSTVTLVLSSVSGVWLDSSGTIVTSRPMTGEQVIAPNGVVAKGRCRVVETLTGVPVRTFDVSVIDAATVDTGRDVGTVLGASGAATGAAAPLTLTATGPTVVPLKIVSDPSQSVDQFQVIGQSRGLNSGNYRTIVNQNGGLQTNGAILIQADVWTGTNYDVPGTMAQGRGICLGIRSDVTGPTFFQASNGSADYEEFQNGSAQVVWNLKIAPSSGGSGVFLGIGDVPISTLTLSDLRDPANVPALTIRHGTASARIGLGAGGTGELDISNNFKSGENAFAEYALNIGINGAFIYNATAPAGTRSEVAFFSKNTTRINTTGLAINYIDGTTLLMAYEPGNGNMRFRTTDTGSGVGVMGFGNSVTMPSTTPAGGGVLYVQAGALKWKGSSGTVTTIAAA